MTVRKRRKNERNVLAAKKQSIKSTLCKYGNKIKQNLLSDLSCDSREDDRNSILPDQSDSDSMEDNRNSILPESSTIDLDPNCCRRYLVDMEQTNWKFSFHTLELPDINSIGMDTELMTINPVSDLFHYMSIPVLSAFGLVFENTLQELRYSYMNLIQTINSTGRWFLLPSDNDIIQLCAHDIMFFIHSLTISYTHTYIAITYTLC